MNCEQYLEQAFRRSPEIGSGEPAESVSDHLLSCQDCLQASPVLKQFHQYEDLPTPLSFLEDVLSQLEQNKTTIKCLDCEHAEGDLSAFLDGELGAEREEQVILHLANCDDCTFTLTELKGLSGALGRSYSEPLSAPMDFAAMVTRAAFADEESKQSGPLISRSGAGGPAMRIGPRPRFKGWLSAAAAVMLTATLSIVMFNNNSNPQKVGSDVAQADRLEKARARKASGSTESLLKMATEHDRYFKEMDFKKADKRLGARKPKLLSPPKAKSFGAGKNEGGVGNSDGQDAAQSRLDAAEELAAVLMLSTANVEQARVDISLLVSNYRTLWENNGDNETWELELSESEAKALVTKLKAQSNIQLALLEKRSEYSDFTKLSEALEEDEKGKGWDPAKDVENMQKGESKPNAKTTKKKQGRPKKAVVTPGKAPDPSPVAKKVGMASRADSLKGVDTIVLRSGWNLSGTILEEGRDTLTMLSAGQKVNVRRKDIACFTRGSPELLDQRSNRQAAVYRIRLVLTTPENRDRVRRKAEKKK